MVMCVGYLPGVDQRRLGLLPGLSPFRLEDMGGRGGLQKGQ